MKNLRIALFMLVIFLLASCSSEVENREKVSKAKDEVSTYHEKRSQIEEVSEEHEIPPYYESHLRIDELDFNQNITFRTYEGLYYTEGPFNSSYSYSFYGYVDDQTIVINEILHGSDSHSSSIYYRVEVGKKIVLPGNIIAEVIGLAPENNEITVKFVLE